MNYYGTTRSNYVEWIDVEGVQELLSHFYIRLEEHEGKHAMFTAGEDTWCLNNINEDGKDIFLDIEIDLAPFLKDGEVLIIFETGAEGARYLVGYSQAYTNKGLLCTIDIDDIYEKAKQACADLGIENPSITKAEY